MCACICAQGGQKGVGSLYLEIQAVVNCLMQALKSNFRSSTRTACTLKHRPFLQPHGFTYFNRLVTYAEGLIVPTYFCSVFLPWDMKYFH